MIYRWPLRDFRLQLSCGLWELETGPSDRHAARRSHFRQTVGRPTGQADSEEEEEGDIKFGQNRQPSAGSANESAAVEREIQNYQPARVGLGRRVVGS